jgi:uncharacterized protein YgbK (DUF1537 family)
MKRIGIVADDLTGAMDSGLPFHGLGLRTRVHLSPDRVGEEGVAVLDTESRESSPSEAYARVWQAARRLRGRTLYKKIDSTLRGNLGQELDAVLDALTLRRALVTPAFPAAGRTVASGQLLVGELPLRQTDFREDPLCPADDHIPTLLRAQTRRSVGQVGVEAMGAGTVSLLDEVRCRPEQLLVIDASSDAHLAAVAGAAAALGEGCLSCGSAGLAGALAEAMQEPVSPQRPRTRHARPGPVLVVAGSRRQATQRQVDRALADLNATRLQIVPEAPTSSAERAREAACGHLGRGWHVILAAAPEPYLPGLDQQLARTLGEVAAAVVLSQPLAGLVLTGGATATAVCRALGIDSLEIEAELAPGIPAGRVVGGRWAGLGVVTKAGGFGREDVLVQAIAYLVAGGGDGG